MNMKRQNENILQNISNKPASLVRLTLQNIFKVNYVFQCAQHNSCSQCAQCALMVCLRFGITFQYYSTQNVNDSPFYACTNDNTYKYRESRDGSFPHFFFTMSSLRRCFFFFRCSFYFANFLLMSEDFVHGLFNSANVIDTLENDPSERERNGRNKNGKCYLCFMH